MTKDETEILEQTLEFADLRVTEVMRPQEEMIILDIQKPIKSLLQIISEQRYSRYPVYDSAKEEIIGIIHIKDLFAALYKQNGIESLPPYIRPILKVSHRLPALDLLRKFREGMPHFALVYMNKGNLIGFVTLDNLLHVLIGRIQDEFHKTKDDWIKHPDGSLSARGGYSIYSLERALGLDISVSAEEENIDTIGELIMTRIGRLPAEGELINFEEFDAIIEEINMTHIRKIKINSKLILEKNPS